MTSRETVLYSGLTDDDAPLEKGIALILAKYQKEAEKKLKEWELISERIIFAIKVLV